MDTMEQLNKEHEIRQLSLVKTKMPVILLGLLLGAAGIVPGVLLFFI